MGDWGYKVYENDEAADWFASFWESKDFDLLAQEVSNSTLRKKITTPSALLPMC